jgi:hypothetical protein
MSFLRAASTELLIASTWDGEPIAAAEQVEVRLRRLQSGLRIGVRAPLHHDPPPATPPGPTDALWEHEVVELFVAAEPAADGARPYTEIELSPWGHHLVLRLHGERQRIAERLPLRYRARRRGDRWVGSARIDGALLPAWPWRVNAFAIHGSGASRRYLAATPLPGARPDFHQPARYPPFPG